MRLLLMLAIPAVLLASVPACLVASRVVQDREIQSTPLRPVSADPAAWRPIRVILTTATAAAPAPRHQVVALEHIPAALEGTTSHTFLVSPGAEGVDGVRRLRVEPRPDGSQTVVFEYYWDDYVYRQEYVATAVGVRPTGFVSIFGPALSMESGLKVTPYVAAVSLLAFIAAILTLRWHENNYAE